MLRVSTIRRRRRRRRRIFFLVCILAVGSLLVFGLQKYDPLKSFSDSKASAKKSEKIQTKVTKVSTVVQHDTAADIQSVFNQYPDVSCSVSYINLLNGQKMNFGSSQPFTGASTTKLITATAFLHGVENGTQSLSEPLGSYTAQWQLQQMIQESNNNSWAYLDGAVGAEELSEYASSIGVYFDYNSNSVTASGMALLLQKLYNGQLLNSADTSLLLSYMHNTNNEDLIPAALPVGAVVHHKYGNYSNFLNDDAIIQENGKSFVLTIYTNDTDGYNYQLQETVIHQIVKTILNDI